MKSEDNIDQESKPAMDDEQKGAASSELDMEGNDDDYISIRQSVINHQPSTSQKNTLTTQILLSEETIKIDFVPLLKSSYSEIVPEVDKEILKKFYSSRILVINHESKQKELGMAAMEKIAFNQEEVFDPHPISCQLPERENFSLIEIIRFFKATKKLFSPTKKQVLIIYDYREDAEITEQFLKDISEKGGPAENITSLLMNSNIHVIYLCQRSDLFEFQSTNKLHFSLYNLNSLQLLLYKKLGDYFSAVKYLYEINEVCKKTGWLCDLQEHDKLIEIGKLIDANALDEELKKAKDSIDIPNEKEIAKSMLEDPLKNIILFVAVYFDNISLIEFNSLVLLLLPKPNSIFTGQEGESGEKNLCEKWEAESHTLLEECGIISEFSESTKYQVYKFKKEINREIVSNLFNNQRILFVAKRFEIIERFVLSGGQKLSRALFDGFVRLCFACAQIDSDRYLTSMCLYMAQSVLKKSAAKERSHLLDYEIFNRLMRFLFTWHAHVQFASSINRFYDRMRENAERRNILGAILTRICTPVHNENLVWFKSHLEGIGRDEIPNNFNVIYKICDNYRDELPIFLKEIEDWRLGRSSDTALRSMSYIQCSFLLAFCKKWDSIWMKGDTGLQLFQLMLFNNPAEGMHQLSRFVFGNKNSIAFNQVFTDDIHLTHALVLIQWFHLLETTKDENFEQNARQLITISVQQLLKEYDTRTVHIALKAAVNQYDKLIVENIRKRSIDMILQENLILKRNHGLELLKIINQ